MLPKQSLASAGQPRAVIAVACLSPFSCAAYPLSLVHLLCRPLILLLTSLSHTHKLHTNVHTCTHAHKYTNLEATTPKCRQSSCRFRLSLPIPFTLSPQACLPASVYPSFSLYVSVSFSLYVSLSFSLYVSVSFSLSCCVFAILLCRFNRFLDGPLCLISDALCLISVSDLCLSVSHLCLRSQSLYLSSSHSRSFLCISRSMFWYKEKKCLNDA